MSLDEGILFVIGAMITIGVLHQIVTRLFPQDAKEQRRCRRNYGKVVARAKRPMVMLSARVRRA